MRLTHSLEVAQIGRAMARALGLNEDLTEALCLAHDIGHPPFGHAGEDALEAAMAEVGGFDHNAHTLRLLTRLESPYPRFAGLNLGWETLEGLAKHNGPVSGPWPWALAEANAQFDLELGSWPGLEAQIAAIADDIAYDNHDIDDGLRAGLFNLEQLLAEVPLAAEAWAAVETRYPDVAPARLVPELVRELIGRMVNDVLAETVLRTGGLRTIDDVRAAGGQRAGFSKQMALQERALKRFLYTHMYDAPAVKAVRSDAQAILAGLFAAYRDNTALLPVDWQPGSDDPVEVTRGIGDFIAGMTDRYAVRRYEELFGPSPLHDL